MSINPDAFTNPVTVRVCIKLVCLRIGSCPDTQLTLIPVVSARLSGSVVSRQKWERPARHAKTCGLGSRQIAVDRRCTIRHKAGDMLRIRAK